MDFETININELNPAQYNPRIMKPSEQLKLRKGLETFGLIDPIIIDLKHDNTVIGGHQRLEVLKEMYGDTNIQLLRLGDVGLVFHETDFKIKDLNDQKAMNLSLNKISGDWDFNLLDELLVDLSDDHYDIDLTGFDEFEIEDILFDEDESLGADFVDQKIDEALGNIYGGLELNEKINDGKADNRIISFYTSDEQLYDKFLDFLGLNHVKRDKKRNIKLETLECLKEADTD